MIIETWVWIALALVVIGVATYFVIRYKRGVKKEEITQSGADEVQPEKPPSVVLDIHSARHVITTTEKPLSRLAKRRKAKEEKRKFIEEHKAVLGMPKLTDNQRLRVERHHRRSVKHGKVAR